MTVTSFGTNTTQGMPLPKNGISEFLINGTTVKIKYVSVRFKSDHYLKAGPRLVQGYLKKLTRENSIFFSPCFEMRYCVLDLDRMTFRYAKSPKHQFLTINYDAIGACRSSDPRSSKSLEKVKDPQDLKYLLFVLTQQRTFILSANTKPDQKMWLDGFQAFFDLKQELEVIVKKQRMMGLS